MTAKSLANAYSQSLGNIFTSEMKPYECEVLVAAVGDTPERNELFHILFDGSVTDRQGWVAMGGQAEALGTYLTEKFPKKPADLKTVIKLGDDALKSVEGRDVPGEHLEVAVLDRNKTRRKFRRLPLDEVNQLLK